MVDTLTPVRPRPASRSPPRDPSTLARPCVTAPLRVSSAEEALYPPCASTPHASSSLTQPPRPPSLPALKVITGAWLRVTNLLGVIQTTLNRQAAGGILEWHTVAFPLRERAIALMADTGDSGPVVVDGESFLDALFASAGQG